MQSFTSKRVIGSASKTVLGVVIKRLNQAYKVHQYDGTKVWAARRLHMREISRISMRDHES